MIDVNEYFEGAVKSLAYNTAEGKSTIGVIETGEYEFGTSSHETMTVIEGELTALLPGAQNWVVFHAKAAGRDLSPIYPGRNQRQQH